MLKIHGLLKSDEGDYECTVSNSKGSIRWDISFQLTDSLTCQAETIITTMLSLGETEHFYKMTIFCT